MILGHSASPSSWRAAPASPVGGGPSGRRPSAAFFRHPPAGGRAEQGRALSRASPEAVLSGRAKCRLNVIRWHEGHGRNVTRTANHFNYSRPTIHAWLERYRRARPKGLEDRSRRPLRLRTPTWSGDLERRGLGLRGEFPRLGEGKVVIPFRREGVE